MIFTYDNTVTAQQRRWIEDAIARCSYPLARLEVDVSFVVAPEPPAPGHKDYMCVVQDAAAAFTVTIREGADDPSRDFNRSIPNPPQNIRTFFRESVVHELMHVVAMTFITDDGPRTTVANGFYRRDSGEGVMPGGLADWNPLGSPWEDRIQEALAEVMKDTFLEDSARVYDNRTNWEIIPAAFDAVMAMVSPAATGVVIPLYVRTANTVGFTTGSWYQLNSVDGEPPFSHGRGRDLVQTSFMFTTADEIDTSVWSDQVAHAVATAPLVTDVAVEFPADRSFDDDGPGPSLNLRTSEVMHCTMELHSFPVDGTPIGAYETLGQFSLYCVRDGANVKFLGEGGGWETDPPIVNGEHIGTYAPAKFNYSLVTNLATPDPTKIYEVWTQATISQGLQDEPYDDFWFWHSTGFNGSLHSGYPTEKFSVQTYVPGDGPVGAVWPYAPPEVAHQVGGAGFMRLNR